MTRENANETREYVQKRYGKLAKGIFQTLKESTLSACCESPSRSGDKLTGMMGYSNEDLDGVLGEANMGLGCGNPKAIAALKPGEVVLDLGSGGGFDCFLAAKEVGKSGKVIGVDMTPEMINKARKHAEKMEATNVEFRLGEIEHLPAADSSVDVIISNCVINLSPEKQKVHQEMFRVLKPGGRLAISDIVALKPLPKEFKKDLAVVSRCIGGAATIPQIERMLTDTGFHDIRINASAALGAVANQCFPEKKVSDYVASAMIEATKPDLRNV